MEAKEAAIGPQGFPRGLSRSPVLALIRPSDGESLGRCGRGPTSQQAQRAWGFWGGVLCRDHAAIPSVLICWRRRGAPSMAASPAMLTAAPNPYAPLFGIDVKSGCNHTLASKPRKWCPEWLRVSGFSESTSKRRWQQLSVNSRGVDKTPTCRKDACAGGKEL